MLGAELEKARKRAGLTQEALAVKAGLTREYVSHLERGKYSPTVEVLLRLAAAMQTRAWRLLRRFEETQRPRLPRLRP